jgi:hypothetical protein
MGYVYAFSNESMPGLFKIGMTKRTIHDILNEANAPDEFLPPTPYMIAHCIKVTNYKKIKKIISNRISSKKVNPNRDFFKISFEDLNDIFNNIDTD